MIPSFAYPWVLVLLPLPFLVAWLAPTHESPRAAVRVPFFARLVALTGAAPGSGAVVLHRPRGRLLLLLSPLLLLHLVDRDALAQLGQNGGRARVCGGQLGLRQQRRGGELDLLAKAAAQRERIRQVAVADGEDAQPFIRRHRRRGTFQRR